MRVPLPVARPVSLGSGGVPANRRIEHHEVEDPLRCIIPVAGGGARLVARLARVRRALIGVFDGPEAR